MLLELKKMEDIAVSASLGSVPNKLIEFPLSALHLWLIDRDIRKLGRR